MNKLSDEVIGIINSDLNRNSTRESGEFSVDVSSENEITLDETQLCFFDDDEISDIDPSRDGLNFQAADRSIKLQAEAISEESKSGPSADESPIDSGQPFPLSVALCDDLLLKELSSIPDRMAFKIGDVADLLGIKQYVLRYWETEFDILRPRKAANNQRVYSRRDVENAFLIRKLLHRDRFSIEGARHALKDLRQFVRKEVVKEKKMVAVAHRFHSLNESVQSLLSDLRRLKKNFC